MYTRLWSLLTLLVWTPPRADLHVMTVVQVAREWDGWGTGAQCGSDEFWWKETRREIVHRRAGCAVGSSCCSSSERQTLQHPSESLLRGVGKLLEGLFTNSCFSSMENRSKGINCLSSLCSRPWLWATFPFLGPETTQAERWGSFEPGRGLASSDQPLGLFGGAWARHWQHLSKSHESLNNHETLPEKVIYIYSVLWDKKCIKAK